jgi:hypothetical protein
MFHPAKDHPNAPVNHLYFYQHGLITRFVHDPTGFSAQHLQPERTSCTLIYACQQRNNASR